MLFLTILHVILSFKIFMNSQKTILKLNLLFIFLK